MRYRILIAELPSVSVLLNQALNLKSRNVSEEEVLD